MVALYFSYTLSFIPCKWYDEWESTPYIIRDTIVGAAKHSNRENEEKNKGEREKNGWGSFEFQFHSSNTFAAVMIWCWAIQCCLKWSSENPGIRYLHVNYSETMAPQHFQRSMQFSHSLTLTRTHPAAFIFEMAAFTTPPEFRSLFSAIMKSNGILILCSNLNWIYFMQLIQLGARWNLYIISRAILHICTLQHSCGRNRPLRLISFRN